MTRCDLCGQPAHCVEKEIDGRVFDVCAPCWHPLAEKLSGKGHAPQSLRNYEQEQELEEYDEIFTY